MQVGGQQHDYITARLFVTDKIEIEGPDGMYTKQNSGDFIILHQRLSKITRVHLCSSEIEDGNSLLQSKKKRQKNV